MTDELDKLREAFQRDGASQPEEKARQASIEAAMLRFEELQEEEKSPSRQGMGVLARLKKQAGMILADFLRRISMALTTKRLSYMMAGGVSLAAIVLAVNLNIPDPVTGPASLRGPEPVPATSDDAVRMKDEQAAEGMQLRAEEPPVLPEADVSAPPAAPMMMSPAPALRETLSRERSAKMRVAPTSVGGGMLAAVPNAEGLPAPVYQDQGRDRFYDVPDNPVKRVAEDPVSTFSADVDTASYSFIRKSLNEGVLPPKDAVRIEEMVNYFDYDYPVPESREAPFKADVEIMPTPWNAETQLMRIGIKGYDIERANAPKANLVFLIDTSGSMNSPDKLPLLRQAFRMLVSNLKPDDVVSIVTYAGSAGTVLEPTPVSKGAKIMSGLDRLSAGGSTAGGEGIRQAYTLAEQHLDKDGINRVILATDGDFNVGISNPEQLKDFIERKRETGVTLSVLGFGRGNYNDLLMQELAQNGNGNAAYIDNLNEARKVLVDQAGSTLFPIAKDVKFQIEFNPAQIGEYRLIGYETRKLDRADFNNDKVDAGDIGAGHTVTALYEIRPAAASGALIEPLRYQATKPATTSAPEDELGFLKIRYKLPSEDTSKLITVPVTRDKVKEDIAGASKDTQFAAAVAAFGEILKGGQYTGDFGLQDVLKLAGAARGDDPFNYRGGFLDLVRLAESAQAMEPLKR